MFRLCALVGIEHSLCWGGWEPGLRSVSGGSSQRHRGRTQELRLGLAPPTRPGGGACLLLVCS